MHDDLLDVHDETDKLADYDEVYDDQVDYILDDDDEMDENDEIQKLVLYDEQRIEIYIVYDEDDEDDDHVVEHDIDELDDDLLNY